MCVLVFIYLCTQDSAEWAAWLLSEELDISTFNEAVAYSNLFVALFSRKSIEFEEILLRSTIFSKTVITLWNKLLTQDTSPHDSALSESLLEVAIGKICCALLSKLIQPDQDIKAIAKSFSANLQAFAQFIIDFSAFKTEGIIYEVSPIIIFTYLNVFHTWITARNIASKSGF